MKVWRIISFLMLFIIPFINQDAISAEKDTNHIWSQYRLNSNNNPVLDIDSVRLNQQTIQTNNEIRSTPVVVGEKVFIGNHESGELYAFNLNTGDQLWKNEAPNWVHSEMIYADGQLFVGYGNRFYQDNEVRGTGESGLLSLDPENGKILWNFKTDGEVMPTPAYYKDHVYITTGDKHLYAVDPEKGEEDWSLELGSVVSMSAPNIKDGVLYVGGSNPYRFFAVDLDDKELKWNKSFEKVTSGLDDVPSVVSDNGMVYTSGIQDTEHPLSIKEVFKKDGALGAYKQMIKRTVGGLINRKPQINYEHKLYAMDANTGDIVWDKSLGKGPMVSNNKSGAPMLYDGNVFVGSPITKAFYGFDASNGKQLWKYDSHVNKAPPVADDDIVYFTDTKGLVYAFDTESGELQGKKKLGGTLAPSGPLLVNDNLVVGSQDHNVYSVPTEDILQANDSVEDDSSLFSYIFFIYVLPIVAVLGVIAILVFLVKLVKKTRKNDNVLG